MTRKKDHTLSLLLLSLLPMLQREFVVLHGLTVSWALEVNSVGFR